MKILFLSHRVPYPPNRGDKLRSFNILRHLALKNEVYLCSVADRHSDLIFEKELLEFCKQVGFEYISPKQKKLTSFIPFFTGEAITMHHFRSPELKTLVEETVEDKKIDLIYVYSSSMSQYIPDSFSGKVIMDFIDADSDKWRQYAEFSRMPMKAVYKREYKHMQKVEKIALDRADVSLVVSEQDKEILLQLNQKAHVMVVRNGVDRDYFSTLQTHTEPFSVVFTGVMDYFPNIDGMLYFIEYMWDEIRQRVPQAKLYIVGGHPVKSLLEYSGTNNIHVTGFVKDIRDYLHRATVGVVPLRIARGIQNKVLEALASGIPVVASEIASEGIDLVKEDGLFVYKDLSECVDRIVMILQDKAYRDELSRKALKAIKEKFGWNEPFAIIDDIIAKVHR